MNSTYTVTAENRLSLCDTVSDAVGAFCAPYCRENRDILRYRLSVEECLLQWLTEDAVGQALTLQCEKKRFRAPKIKLSFSGKACNPFATEEQTYGTFSGSTLRTMGLAPEYSYAGGMNQLEFTVAKTASTKLRLFGAAVLLGCLVGYFGKLLLPASAVTACNDILLTPFYELFTSLLSLVACPLIFLSVAWGIYGIGDTASFSKVGKSVIASYLRNTAGICLLGLCAIPFFRLKIAGGSVSFSRFGELVELIFGCVPKNIVEPFSEGNTLQVIFLATVTGIAMLFLGKKTAAVAKAVEQINVLLQYLMSFITRLVPGLVFVIIIKLFWEGTFSVVASAWRLLAVLVGGCAVICLLFLTVTSLRYRVSPLRIVKKVMPSVLIAALTASSAATFENTVRICNSELGVDKSVAGFGIPLGMVMHNPIAAFYNLIVVFFFAQIYGVECSPVWFITAVFCCSLLALASPPIPGGGIIVYTMLFMQFGIPMEAVAFITAVDVLTDFVITSSEIFCLFPGLVLAADKVGRLDKAVLRK